MHIAEGSSHGETGLNLREKEIKALVGHLKKSAKRSAGKTIDRDFFVLGDFNIQGHEDRFFNALTEGPNPKFVMPPSMNQIGTNFDQSKTYDKIAWIDRKGFNFTGNLGVIPFGDVLFKEDGQPPKEARKKVSDHLPLWAEFSINKLSQELDQILNN